MQQVKIFTGIENQTGDMEQEINDWLKSSGANVIQITGNIAPQAVLGSGDHKTIAASAGASRRYAPSDVMVVVLYETGDA